MKWGVRRFQRKDGSRTAAGLKRARENDKANDKNNDPQTKRKTANNNPVKSDKESGKSKNSVSDYRQKQIDKAIKSGNTKDLAFYTNISDEVIQQEMVRRENVKKAVIAGAVVVGVATAGYVAYRMSVNNQLKAFGGDLTKDKMGDILDKAQIDLSDGLSDIRIPKGSEIHRQVAYKDFDVSRMKDKMMYATTNKTDTAAYMAFLKDWHGTGERYDVKMETITDILAPSDKKAREIFDDVWNNNPEYRMKLQKTLIDSYTKLGATEEQALYTVTQTLLDPDKRFKDGGMYALVKGQEDSGILRDAYRKAGYTAITDYFDKGVMGKAPMIFFDADTQMVKTGETFVTEAMKKQSAMTVFADRSHPLFRSARQWVYQAGLISMEEFIKSG